MLAFKITKNPNPKKWTPIIKRHLPKCKVPLRYFSNVQGPEKIELVLELPANTESISKYHQ